jgi:hypothetical protein
LVDRLKREPVKTAQSDLYRTLRVDYTCVSDVQFGCAFHRRMRYQCHFSVKNSKIRLKMHATVKRTPKLHIQNASVIDPLACTAELPLVSHNICCNNWLPQSTMHTISYCNHFFAVTFFYFKYSIGFSNRLL